MVVGMYGQQDRDADAPFWNPTQSGAGSKEVSYTLSGFQLGTGVCSPDCSPGEIILGAAFRSTFHSLGGVGHCDRYMSRPLIL